MSITHAVIGFASMRSVIAAAGISLILGTTEPLPLDLPLSVRSFPTWTLPLQPLEKFSFLATAAIALLCLGIYLANVGGITQKVSQNLGLRDGIIRVYNENASTNKVYANIKGFWSSDRTITDGKHLVIGNEGSEFMERRFIRLENR